MLTSSSPSWKKASSTCHATLSGPAGMESEATTLPEIIQEMLLTKSSERQGRLIDSDQSGSMEKKKREGYF